MPDFIEGHGDPKRSFVHTMHGNVKPIAPQGCFFSVHFANDFTPCDACMADIGAEPGIAFLWMRQRKRENLGITPKPDPIVVTFAFATSPHA